MIAFSNSKDCAAAGNKEGLQAVVPIAEKKYII